MAETLIRFHYQVLDARGRPRQGELDALHADAAVGELDRKGWRVQSLRPLTESDSDPVLVLKLDDPQAPGVQLSLAESEELSGHLAEVVGAGMPLESGLAAIAEELPARRLRRAMRAVVARLERGAGLDEALRQSGASPYLQAVVRAGSRSGSLGSVLEHYAGTSEALRGTLPVVIGALSYSAVACGMWLLIAVLITLYVIPSFASLYEGFGIQLPVLTMAVFEIGKFLREYWLVFGLALAAFFVGVPCLFFPVFGRVATRRLLHSIPGVGTVVRSLAMCRFSVLLSLLVDNRIPLPEALPLAGDATGDAAVAADARKLAAQIERGGAIRPESWDRGTFSNGFVQAIVAPSGHELLINGLESLAEVYASRVRYGLTFLAAVLPPLLMIGLGLCTAVIVLALYLPLIKLLDILS